MAASDPEGTGDELPLQQPTPPSSPTDVKIKREFPGLFLDKTKLIVIAVVVIVLVVLIIILAALLGHANLKLRRQGKVYRFLSSNSSSTACIRTEILH